MAPPASFRTTTPNYKEMDCRQVSTQTQEDQSFSAIFDRFRGREGLDLLWVKEQVYGTPCLPESCPTTRTIGELRGSLLRDKPEFSARNSR
jgi:hypothetical protein